MNSQSAALLLTVPVVHTASNTSAMCSDSVSLHRQRPTCTQTHSSVSGRCAPSHMVPEISTSTLPVCHVVRMLTLLTASDVSATSSFFIFLRGQHRARTHTYHSLTTSFLSSPSCLKHTHKQKTRYSSVHNRKITNGKKESSHLGCVHLFSLQAKYLYTPFFLSLQTPCFLLFCRSRTH